MNPNLFANQMTDGKTFGRTLCLTIVSHICPHTHTAHAYLCAQHAVKPRDHKRAAHESRGQQINHTRHNPPAVVERTPQRVFAHFEAADERPFEHDGEQHETSVEEGDTAAGPGRGRCI